MMSVRLGGHSLSATVLTSLLFIADPSPSFDVYGKVGVAQLEESFDVGVFRNRLVPLRRFRSPVQG
jgi:hypothetical protein